MAEIQLIPPRATRGADFASLDADSGEIDTSFTFDITAEESISASVEWTQDPIEDGSSTTDHFTRAPLTASFSGLVSATTLDRDSPLKWDNPNRLGDAKDALLKMVAEGKELIVVTPFQVITNMRLSSAEISRGTADGHAFSASISLVEIVTTSAQSIDIPPELVRKKTRDTATPKLSAGTQTGKEPEPEQTEEVLGDSLLFKAFG